jgi:hypothetical protein
MRVTNPLAPVMMAIRLLSPLMSTSSLVITDGAENDLERDSTFGKFQGG